MNYLYDEGSYTLVEKYKEELKMVSIVREAGMVGKEHFVTLDMDGDRIYALLNEEEYKCLKKRSPLS